MKLKFPPKEALPHIWKLHEKPGLFCRVFGMRGARINLLKKLDHFPERGLIRDIMFILFDPDFRVASQAGKMIEKRLKDISLNELCMLDPTMRLQNEHSYSMFWNFEIEDLKMLERFENPAPFLGLASFFPNGYVREAAIRRLSHFKTGDEIKYLLLRLNDWVPQIRLLAKSEILSRIGPDQIKYFLDSFDLIQRIYSWERDDHSEVLNAIEETISHPNSKDHLLRGCTHDNFRIRRLSVEIAAKEKVIPPLELYKKIAKDADPMVRLQFINYSKPHLKRDELTYLCTVLASEGFMRIRKEIQDIAVSEKIDNYSEILHQALCDPHISIRESARWYLAEKGKDKSYFRSIYIKNIKKNTLPKIGAVLGLGETGASEDIVLITPYLTHKRAKFRCAAFRVIGQLHPDYLSDIALKKLKNETASVIKEIGSFIYYHFDYFKVSELWDIFEKTESLHVKISILSITERISKWMRIIYLLRAGEQDSYEIKICVEKKLVRWILNFNKSFNEPTQWEKETIQSLLIASSLNPALIEKLRPYITSF